MTTATRPSPGQSRPYRFPLFEEHRLANGLRLIVAPVRKVPLVTAVLVVDAGAASDAVGAEGIALITARSLVEGTPAFDGAALAERLEGLGAALEPTADWDRTMATLTVTSARLQAALELMASVVLEPSFPEREIERLKKERLAEVMQTRAEPRGLADEMFSRFVYAPASRYARAEGGTEASIESLARDGVAAFHRARYVPRGATLILAGDVGVEEGVALAGRVFGSWPARGAAESVVSDAPAAVGRSVRIVTKADAPQSELRIGHVGVPRSHRDYFAIVVMNAILGGLFSSRINLNLRETHAYTYGAFSHYDWRRMSGPFVVSTAVRSDVTDAATSEVLLEMLRIREGPVTGEELSLATSYLAGVFPIRYETTEAIAGALSVLAVYGLPADYFDTYRDRVRAVTADDVLRAARAYVHPEKAQIVVVGDPAAVRAPLEKLEIGPVSEHAAEL